MSPDEIKAHPLEPVPFTPGLPRQIKPRPVPFTPGLPRQIKPSGRKPQRWPVARRKTVRRAKARAARVARRENRR